MRSRPVAAWMRSWTCCTTGRATRRGRPSLRRGCIAQGWLAAGIEDYVYNHLSLVYLVAAADDPVVKRLVEETLPACHKRLPLPLVLIEGKPAEGFAAAAAL